MQIWSWPVLFEQLFFRTLEQKHIANELLKLLVSIKVCRFWKVLGAYYTNTLDKI